ncbi:MAG: hypothetical protein ACO1Q7_07015, partial [Gemmatimonas sp.]
MHTLPRSAGRAVLATLGLFSLSACASKGPSAAVTDIPATTTVSRPTIASGGPTFQTGIEGARARA